MCCKLVDIRFWDFVRTARKSRCEPPNRRKNTRMFLAKPPRADENGILGRFWAIIKQHFPFTGMPHKITSETAQFLAATFFSPPKPSLGLAHDLCRDFSASAHYIQAPVAGSQSQDRLRWLPADRSGILQRQGERRARTRRRWGPARLVGRPCTGAPNFSGSVHPVPAPRCPGVGARR